jgi:hypothetical protein
MFSSLLEPDKVRLFQTTDAYSSFERIMVIQKTFRLFKEEKLYVMKPISPNIFSVWDCKESNHVDENAIYYLT